MVVIKYRFAESKSGLTGDINLQPVDFNRYDTTITKSTGITNPLGAGGSLLVQVVPKLFARAGFVILRPIPLNGDKPRDNG